MSKVVNLIAPVEKVVVVKTTKNKKVVKSSELSESGVRAVKLFNKAKEAEAKAKALKSEAEAILRQELGTSVEGTIDGLVAVKLVSSSNTHFDREILKEMLTEKQFADALKTTSYDYIKTL